VIPATYTGFELLRTFRNRRFMIISLAFPLVLFFLVAGPNRDQHLGGIPFTVYYMTGMAAWGGMAAMLSCGARIATERSVGWTRQLRTTPLPTRAYFRAKLLTAYVLASLSIVLLYAAGISLGVHLSAADWLEMTGLLLVGLVPFGVLGVLLGHLLTPDSIGPAIGGGTSLLALLGGAFGPIATTGFLHDVVRLLPSYWLVQAGKVAFGAGAWGAEGWIVVAAWTVVLLRLTAFVYRRDTARV
jgi:ABC-2 type transport system permease protein